MKQINQLLKIMGPIIIFLVLSVLLTPLLAEDLPTVQLPKGKIQGYSKITPTEEKKFHLFLGIPYAKPPLGNLRFQPPQEPDGWEGTLDATKDSNICYATTYNNARENEDCLYLDVFTPALDLVNTTKKLPVMFSIYGGAFRSGSDLYGGSGPEWWLEQGIIVVSFNYRIGPFGFLSTGDLTLPGNAGLKDQNFALKWTYENIHLFGGDRDQITITGQSAGGASVTFHLLSPKSQGYYRAAVSESGSAICPWTYIANPIDYVKDLAKAVNNGVAYPSTNSKDLLEYLQRADAKVIDNLSSKMYLTLPVIEPQHEDAFITEAFYELLANGKSAKVPVLMGINSEEELVMAKNIPNLKTRAAAYDKNHMNLIPSAIRSSLSKTNIAIVGDIIKKAYVGDDSFANNLGKVVAYASDFNFNKANIKFGELQSKISNVYFYQFSYKGVMGNVDVHIDGADDVSHGEEGHYMHVYRGTFDNTKFENFPKADVTTHYRLIKLFSNFIKYLNPTPDPSDELLEKVVWPTASPSNFKYLNINTSLTIEDTPKGDRYKMWRNVYETYGVRPFVVY